MYIRGIVFVYSQPLYQFRSDFSLFITVSSAITTYTSNNIAKKKNSNRLCINMHELRTDLCDYFSQLKGPSFTANIIIIGHLLTKSIIRRIPIDSGVEAH